VRIAIIPPGIPIPSWIFWSLLNFSDDVDGVPSAVSTTVPGAPVLDPSPPGDISVGVGILESGADGFAPASSLFPPAMSVLDPSPPDEISVGLGVPDDGVDGFASVGSLLPLGALAVELPPTGMTSVAEAFLTTLIVISSQFKFSTLTQFLHPSHVCLSGTYKLPIAHPTGGKKQGALFFILFWTKASFAQPTWQ